MIEQLKRRQLLLYFIELHSMLMHITVSMLTETRCFDIRRALSVRQMKVSHLSLNLQQILHLSRETPSPLKSNHVRMLSDL